MTLTNDKKESLKDQYIRILAKQVGLSIEEVIDLLRERFETFNLKNKHEYREYILTVVNERENELMQEDIKARQEKEGNQIPFPQCPICGGNTVGDPTKYSKFRNEAGWICSKGGSTHYYMWRTNRILEEKHLQKIFQIPSTEEIIDHKTYLSMDHNDFKKIADKIKDKDHDENYIYNLILSIVGRQTIVVPEPSEELISKTILAIKEWKDGIRISSNNQ